MEYEGKQFSFDDLRGHYGTGRSYTISGEGRNRVIGFRSGMMCNAGDIEISEWYKLVKDAIDRAGEHELFAQLLEFLREKEYSKRSKRELEEYALELHASRIFDNEAWVLFVQFNKKYRPERFAATRLIWVKTNCCKKNCQVCYSMLYRGESIPESVCCPHCGRWSEYEIIEKNEMEESCFETE